MAIMKKDDEEQYLAEDELKVGNVAWEDKG